MQQLTFDFLSQPDSVTDQTGWRRPHPQTLLQDVDLLQKIEVYTYNLKDPEFVRYAHSRGCMNGAGVPGENDPDYTEYTLKHGSVTGDAGQLRRWVRDTWRTIPEFIASRDLRTAINGHVYSEEERRQFATSIRIARGQLQDCWEIYQGR